MKTHQFLEQQKPHNTGRGAKVSLEDKYQLVLLIIPGLEVLKKKNSTIILPECQEPQLPCFARERLGGQQQLGNTNQAGQWWKTQEPSGICIKARGWVQDHHCHSNGQKDFCSQHSTVSSVFVHFYQRDWFREWPVLWHLQLCGFLVLQNWASAFPVRQTISAPPFPTWEKKW